MLEAKDVTIMAGGKACVEHLSFLAEPGKVTCLSGIDEDTAAVVARALLGLWPVSSGFVTLCGEVIAPHSASWLRKMMAYVPRALPDGFGDGPIVLADAAEALRLVDVETKRVVVVEQSDEAAMVELQSLAEKGMAVVVVR